MNERILRPIRTAIIEVMEKMAEQEDTENVLKLAELLKQVTNLATEPDE